MSDVLERHVEIPVWFMKYMAEEVVKEGNISMQEKIEIKNGQGVLSVKGGYTPLLLMNGQPIAMHWCDNEGSICRYLVRSGVVELPSELGDYRYVVDGGFDPARSLFEQFEFLLNLFDNGKYSLTLDTEDEYLDWENYEFRNDIHYDTYLLSLPNEDSSVIFFGDSFMFEIIKEPSK